MFVGLNAPQFGQLPIETTGFVGREGELARLDVLLDQARLVTVTGPGGVGKTRLALRAARRAAPQFADGICLVELSALGEPRLLVHTVAAALGLREQSPGASPDHGGSPDHGARLDAVLAHLRDRHLLLILDTCDHLIDACAMFAESVIVRAPRVTMLATSREPLDVIGENACPVAPLPIPALPDAGGADATGSTGITGAPGSAVELFIQRAAAAVPGFTVAPAELPDVIRICQQLDGIPLAIELAAVRLRALSLADLANRLDQRLTLLTTGHGRMDRHQTLRGAVSWSHELCTPEERNLWARLSVFAGPFTMSAVEEVCGDWPGDDRVMPLVIRLVDKSVLVRIDPAAESADQPTQYLMLDTIREFGASKLAETGNADGTRGRLVSRYLEMARYFRDHFLDDDQPARLAELRREHANVRAALEYALGDTVDSPLIAGASPESGSLETDRASRAARTADGVELAIAMSAYWRARGLAREGSYWLGRAAERAPEGAPAQVRAALERGHLLTVLGEATEALADARAAIATGDAELAAQGYLVAAAALCVDGQLTAAAEASAEAKRRLTALGDRRGLISLDLQLTYLALLNEDTESALGHVEHGLRQLDRSRERWLHANLYLLASLTLYLAGRDIESTWTVTRALQVKQEIGDILGIALTLEILGWLAAKGGGEQRAAWLLGGAGPLWERAGGRLAAAASFERLHTEAVARCEGTLGAKRFADLLAKGAKYPLDAMITFALNDASDPAADSGSKIRLPSQLTAREREIAGLVAAGLSNRQIAEKLFISRRTVDAHLEHIFSKLGITSRVMLTIQLREHSAEPDGGGNS